ncbi:ATP-binding cassette sub-family A member 3 [Papilio machaon]|uniref:ATP-binding cassette sub-family A member 3 n=1 Tax=Papilio machaon TaxID=76193 RepID=A0A194R3K7_PAPMA|nr:ATP-binding cassette sub-family A member 3 [Papilio machaon]
MKGILKVLMLKHLVVRMRRFISTAVELISPAVFFILLYVFKDYINQPVHTHVQNSVNVYKPEPVPLASIRGPWLVFYTPDTELTGQLMDKVAGKLGLSRLKNFPVSLTGRGYYPIQDEAELNDYLNNIDDSQALVVFQNMTGEWPKLLNYTIRMKKDFMTHIYNPLDGGMEPHQAFGLIYETFMRLQWAIDTSYLQLMGIDVKQNVTLQEFPFVKTNSNMNTVISVLVEALMVLCWLSLLLVFVFLMANNKMRIKKNIGTENVTLQEFPFVKTNSNMNTVISVLVEALMVLCWLSLLLVFVFLMARLLDERTTGIEELVKMAGVSSNMLALSHFLNVVPVGIVYCVIDAVLLTASTNPVLISSTGLICLMLALHFISVIAMAFACSYFVKNNQYAVTLSMFAYTALWIPARVVSGRRPPRALLPLTALLPHQPMQLFWEEIAALEKYGHGLTFSNMALTHGEHSMSALLCLVFLALQSVLFAMLTWYLALVNPGPYGQALPWNFMFKRSFWSERKVAPGVDAGSEGVVESEELSTSLAADPLYFEQVPKDLEPGIRIDNVTKVFGKNVVLSNVSLDIYKGEITVLLGHNGAGKTTLMNIITGMISASSGKVYVEGLDTATQQEDVRKTLGLCPQHNLFFPDLTVLEHVMFFTMYCIPGMISASSGKVYVEGLDTATQQEDVRKTLGLCPQHNLFFPDLTVLEHVMFFTMLKGFSYHEAKVESKQLLEKLGLYEKAGSRSAQLSGGMRRRLQLGCALAGGARVLVLDEPTSGLDVETRRELWDLLLSLRGSRTVLLTTHFMEEADALGDRVAALHLGRLRCHATTMHLKRALGTGYRLSFTTIGIPKEPAITSTVQSVVADASMREQSLNSITYNLPAKDTSRFPQLFTVLESKRSELAIDSIGVGISTLEEVFLKLCSDVETTFSEDTVDTAALDATQVKVRGAALCLRQLQVLLKRQFKYMMSKKLSILILQVIMPILTLVIFTYVTVDVEPDIASDSGARLHLSMYDLPEPRLLYSINTSAPIALRTLTDRYSDVSFEPTSDVVNSLVQYGKEDIMEYNKYIAGIEINDTDAVVLYTTRVRHAAPIALNLLSNILSGAPAQAEVVAYNQPLHGKAGPARQNLVQPKSLIMSVMWATVVVFVVLATNLNLVSLPCKERESGARHLHVLAGCAPALHWASTLTAHATLCTLTLLLPAIVVAAIFDTERTLTNLATAPSSGAMFVVLMLGSLAFFAFMYLVSFYFGERGASTLLVACIIIFGFLTTSMKKASDFFKEKQDMDFSYYLLVLCGWIAPPHTFTIAAMKTVNVARLNAYCVLNRQHCPALFVMEDGFDAVTCCQFNRNPRCYFCIDEYSPAESMIIMFCQFVGFMTLVILTQHGIFNRLADRVFNRRYRARGVHAPADDLVRAEGTYVSKAIALPPDQIQDAMLVDDLHKNYVQFIRKSTNAVKGISFSVKKGECFGLLGVNGAGKSTTFKMLTGEECPTRGTIFANGHHIDKNRTKYLRSLGYCPQFFGLDEFQSGYDNLALVLTLRGLAAHDVKTEADNWIEIVGLEQYGSRLVSCYSGGMSRRLGAAAALCGGGAGGVAGGAGGGASRVTLLDEPTAGVDVAARRRVWAAIRHGLAQRRATLVTSHRLCSTSIPKLHLDSVIFFMTDGGVSELQRLKSELHQKFNCELKDEHKTMLHYHINDTMRYSELFNELEALKNSNAIVEDYSVSETTLEEVFLAFAKETEDQEIRATPLASKRPKTKSSDQTHRLNNSARGGEPGLRIRPKTAISAPQSKFIASATSALYRLRPQSLTQRPHLKERKVIATKFE